MSAYVASNIYIHVYKLLWLVSVICLVALTCLLVFGDFSWSILNINLLGG